MNLIRLFIKECLFFKSKEAVNRIFGVTGWLGFVVFLYVVMRILQSAAAEKL
jgi:hypothetical protein